jgi:hypothetical protein
MLKKLLPITLFLFLSLAACSSTSAQTPQSTPQPSPTIAPTPTPHYKVGEVVNVDNIWQITINSVKALDLSSGLYAKPDNGSYIAVDVSFKNISQQEQQITSTTGDFTLRDSSGMQYTEVLLIGPDNLDPPSGKIEPGQPLRGIMTYDVPAKTDFSLSFEPEASVGGNSIEQTATAQLAPTIWDIQS